MIIPVCIALVVLLQVLDPAQGDDTCRPEYLEYSSDHSGCLEPNKQCDILMKGADDQDQDLIVKIHNDYRSKLATGQETRGGGMPQASNMLEITWDDELQGIAEKWAENCEFQHDCNDCRRVSRFSVGQNIAYLEYPCDSVDACKNYGFDVLKPDWPKMIALWYDEVENYDQSSLDSYQFDPSTGHFTQIAWAETYKVGCGFTVYHQTQGSIRQLYVCDYGPAGNYIGEPVYERGSPCSDCPDNGGCGAYDGVCQA